MATDITIKFSKEVAQAVSLLTEARAGCQATDCRFSNVYTMPSDMIIRVGFGLQRIEIGKGGRCMLYEAVE